MPITPSGGFLLRSEIEAKITTNRNLFEIAKRDGLEDRPEAQEWKRQADAYEECINE